MHVLLLLTRRAWRLLVCRTQELSGDKAAPAARHLLLSHNPPLDVTSLRGSGKGGRITKGDVLAALGQISASAAAASSAPAATGARVHLAPSAPAAAAPAPAAGVALT